MQRFIRSLAAAAMVAAISICAPVASAAESKQIYTDGKAVATASVLDKAALNTVADFLWANNPQQLPAGFSNTTAKNAWFTVAANAFQYDGLVLAVSINGGNYTTMLVAKRSTDGLAVIGTYGMYLDQAKPLLEAYAREIAAKRGLAIGKYVDKVVPVPTVVSVFEPL